jgi:hypothetical protein
VIYPYHITTSAWPLVSSVPAAIEYAVPHVARDNMGVLCPVFLSADSFREIRLGQANSPSTTRNCIMVCQIQYVQDGHEPS